MSLVVPWLVFPLVLATASLGCGLLLRAAVGGRLSGALLLPAGVTVTVVAAGYTTLHDATAELTVPVTVALAVAGLGLALRRRPRVDGWAAATAAAVFLAFGAPVLASGEPTFAGYVKLDDTATFLALTDRALEHGRSVEGLAPSSYEATLSLYLADGYPIGALLPLGVGQRLTGTDPAWLFQPYVSFLAAMLGLCLYALAGAVLAAGPLRAFASFIAAQPALLFGYAQWGGVKEVFAATAIALVAASWAFDRSRAGVVSLVAAASLLGAISVGGAVWLLPAALAAVWMLVRRQNTLHAAGAGALAVALSLPALLAADDFLRTASRDVLQSSDELGNLLQPLSGFQLLGVWPAGDFRIDPADSVATWLLLVVTAVCAALGLAHTLARRAWPLLLYALCSLAGVAVLTLRGSPWVDAKALATAAPAVLLLAVLGAVAALRSQRKAEGAVVLLAVAGGVLWSNVLAYREVSLAPHDQLSELERIGEHFAGHGPALLNEYQPYGVRHFLRRLDPESPSELRRRPVRLHDGSMLGKGETVGIEALALDEVLVYRTLVLPTHSTGRPPAVYRPAWTGTFYSVWQRA